MKSLMKRKSSIFAITLFVLMLLPSVMVAQSPSAETRSRWMNEIKKYKFDFFTKELSLDKEQQSKFFPLYEEMEQEIYLVNKEADALMKKVAAADNVSDTEYEAAAIALSKTRQKEGEIELEYFSQFEKILTKKQLFLLKVAEDKFTKTILNYHRQGSNK